MWTFIHRLASPKTTYRLAKRLSPWFALFSLLLFVYGLTTGLLIAPPDYQQGNVYRIMYIHVPSAILSLGVYGVMSVAAIFYLIWRIKVADIIASASVPVGAIFTALTLITGAIWGKPTWGTYWIWDARLTAELILLFIYFGIMAIRSSIPDRTLSAKAGAVVTLIGMVNIPIVHFSVNWWHTLHQGSSIALFGPSTIVPSMLHPLLGMIGAFSFYTAWILCMRVRAELLKRESDTAWVREVLTQGVQHAQ